MPSHTVDELASQLVELLASYGRVAVAFSAGVDSTVVAKAAQFGCGENAVAVTAHSPSLADGELEEARQLAAVIGIRHRVIETQEFSNPDYARNPSNRCWFCKSELYTRLGGMLDELGVDVVVNGANLDDRGDHRPGMLAAREHAVRSPLIETGCTKADVRALAEFWGLPVAHKPAMPCLASRIAYGVEVTQERTRRIDAAERLLAEITGSRELRVRLEADDLARIEVPLSAIASLAAEEHRIRLVSSFKTLGFRAVTLDLEGFRSGNLNAVLPPESISLPGEW